MSKYPIILQEGFKDCGVACMAMIIKYYQGYIPLEKLRQLSNTTKAGTSAYDLCECAKKIGFNAEGIKLDRLNDDIILPCIAHVSVNNYGHYVVIYKVNYKKRYLIIGNPAKGIEKMKFDEFNKIWNGIILNLYPIRNIPIENSTNIFKFIIGYIKNQKKILSLLFVLSLVVTLTSSVSSFYFKTIIDNSNTSYNYLLLILIVFIIVNLIKLITDYFRNKIFILLNQKIDMNMSCDIYNQIVDLPYQYYRNRSTGEIISRFNDLGSIREVNNKIIMGLFMDLPLSIISLIILLNIDLGLSIVLFLVVISYAIIMFIFKSITNSRIDSYQTNKEKTTSHMVETISGFETVKNLNIKIKIKELFEDKYYKLLNSIYKLESIINFKETISNTIYDISILLILFLGMVKVLNQSLTVGQVIMFYSLSMYFLTPIKNFLNIDNSFREAKGAIRRIVNLFIDNNDNGMISKINIGNIKYNNLSYYYTSEKVLDNISLDINIGDKVLITGMSGSGKSTLLKILMNYYQIDNNSLYIDDIDFNYYKNDAIVNDIVYISQNEILFSDSVINNLTLYENEKVLDISKLCEIDDILNSKNINYNSIIEENGFNFSGGERQRFVLGRALLKDFKILLIDEGLNQMDINLERRILKRLFFKYKDKTIIVVSHRLDNSDLYNHLIEISDGRVVKDVAK